MFFQKSVFENIGFEKFFQAEMITSFVYLNKCLSSLLKCLCFIPFFHFEPQQRKRKYENLRVSMHNPQ